MANIDKASHAQARPAHRGEGHGHGDHKGYVDGGWPKNLPADRHAVTELVADTAGALSPYGDIEFPVDPATLPYVHPETHINGKYGL